MIKPFEVIVFQLFLDLLRAAWTALNAQQIEMLRSASQNFSTSFKAEAQLACLEFLKEFQNNVKETIDQFEARITKIELGDTKFQETLKIVGSASQPVVVPSRESLWPIIQGNPPTKVEIISVKSEELDKSQNNPDN